MIKEIYKLISDLPTVYITKFGKTLNVCSKERGELYSKQLEIRYKEILYPFYEKTKEQMEKESGINDLEENEPEI